MPPAIVTTTDHRGDGIDLDGRTNEAKKRGVLFWQPAPIVRNDLMPECPRSIA